MGPSPYAQRSDVGGYNPNQYLTNSSSQDLATQFGGKVVSSGEPQVPIGPPPQNLIDFGNGFQSNAGLLAGNVDRYGMDQAQKMLAAEQAYRPGNVYGDNHEQVGVVNPQTGAPLPWNPPAQAAQPGATPAPGAAPSGQPWWMTPGAFSNNPAYQFQGPLRSSSGGGSNLPWWMTTGGPDPRSTGGTATPPRITGPTGGPTLNPGATGAPETVGMGGGPTPAPGYGSGSDGGLASFFASLNGGGGAATGTTPVPATGTTPDQFLANGANDVGYLQSIAQNGGNPINQTNPWQQMVAAQARQQDVARGKLREQFGASGNRFSTSFGDAAQNFENQTVLDQNSLLGQMTATAGENAQQRMLGASNTLGQFGFQGNSQLSHQDYASQMAQLQASLQASGQLASGSDAAAQMMAQFGAQGAMGMNQNAALGAGQIYGSETNAANSMFGAQNNMLPQLMQYYGQANGQDNQLAQLYSQLFGANTDQGAQLGQQQFGIDAYNLNQQYQEWMRTRPTNSPLLPYIASMASSQPVMYQPQYSPSLLSQFLSAGAQVASAAVLKGCWIAEAVYGNNNSSTHLVRAWLNGPFRSTFLGSAVMKAYVAIGKPVAKLVRCSRFLRAAFKPLLDCALRKANKRYPLGMLDAQYVSDYFARVGV